MPADPRDPDFYARDNALPIILSDLDADLLKAAYDGDTETFEDLLLRGANAQATDSNGLNALHLAIAHNNFAFARILIEQHQLPLIPDGFGRWPTILACQCRVDEDFLQYIDELESALPDS